MPSIRCMLQTVSVSGYEPSQGMHDKNNSSLKTQAKRWSTQWIRPCAQDKLLAVSKPMSNQD